MVWVIMCCLLRDVEEMRLGTTLFALDWSDERALIFPGLLVCSNNLLYPKEERSEKKLYYKCRNCNFQKPASEVRVYSNDVKSAASYVIELGIALCVLLSVCSQRFYGEHVLIDLSVHQSAAYRIKQGDHHGPHSAAVQRATLQ